MKQVKQARPVSHTIQSKTKAANQASIQTVLQKYKAPVAQREITEEDELLQGKFESTAQLMELPEDEEEPLQGKFGSMENGQLNVERVQKKEDPHSTSQAPLSTKNETGLPDQLKSGVENMSGLAMDAVRVHYNSPKPAQLQALAYTQGTDIHVAPGQEKHLPHEAWHVVQQMQGRVQPTMQLQGVNVNDNEGLEREADVMGGRAVQMKKDIYRRGKEASIKKPRLSATQIGDVKDRLKSINEKFINGNNIGDLTLQIGINVLGSTGGLSVNTDKKELESVLQNGTTYVADADSFTNLECISDPVDNQPHHHLVRPQNYSDIITVGNSFDNTIWNSVQED